MKLCFPVKLTQDLESEVYGHFGSAPCFLIVDTASGSITTIANADQHHSHGMCSPFKALSGRAVDAVVVGGIGSGALSKLTAAGVPVYRAMALTVRDNLDLFRAGMLPEFRPNHVCAGHGAHCSHH